jgi:hypothetical protein
MSEKIMSNDEIKAFTGLSAADAKIEIFNKSMTRVLADMLGLKQFSQHSIENEEVRISDGYYIRLRSFPVDIESITLFENPQHDQEITGFTFRTDPYDFRKFFVLDEDGKQSNLCRNYVYVTYDTGFILQGTIEITDNDIEAITLSITDSGVTTVYSFISSGTPGDTEILIGGDEDETMTNIATKIGAVGQDGVVLMPLGMTAETSEVSETPKIVVVNPDEMLDELKLALAYMVAGAMSDKSQAEGIVAYRLGSKSVNFRDMTEKNFAEEVIKKYLSKYKRALILSK